MQLPADVPARIETHLGHDRRQKYVLGGAFAEHGDPLALEIAECPDARSPEYLEAAELDATEHHNRIPRVEPGHVDPCELHHHVRAARGDQPRAQAVGRLDVLHLTEPVSPEQYPSQRRRWDADRGIVDEPNACCLGWRFGSGQLGLEPQEPCSPGQRQSAQKLPPTHASRSLLTHGNLLRQSGHRKRVTEYPTPAAVPVPLAAPDTQNTLHTSRPPNAAAPAAPGARSPPPRAESGYAWPHPLSRSFALAGPGRWRGQRR